MSDTNQPSQQFIDEEHDLQQDEEREIETLRSQLTKCEEAEKRAMADYKNLMRRTQEERMKMMQYATRDVIEHLLQPYEHLYLATEQLKDKGLQMVYQQFQNAFAAEGLAEIVCLGKAFDVGTMEVIGKEPASSDKQVDTVVRVAQRGYTLHGEVIRPAKVIIGEKSDKEKEKVTNKEEHAK